MLVTGGRELQPLASSQSPEDQAKLDEITEQLIEEFLENVEEFVEQVDDVEYVNLFLTGIGFVPFHLALDQAYLRKVDRHCLPPLLREFATLFGLSSRSEIW